MTRRSFQTLSLTRGPCQDNNESRYAGGEEERYRTTSVTRRFSTYLISPLTTVTFFGSVHTLLVKSVVTTDERNTTFFSLPSLLQCYSESRAPATPILSILTSNWWLCLLGRIPHDRYLIAASEETCTNRNHPTRWFRDTYTTA